MNMVERLTEQIETLAGTRQHQNRRDAAVRIADLDGLVQLQQRLQSAQISAAPTAADFNALQADVRRLQDTLNTVANALSQRIVA